MKSVLLIALLVGLVGLYGRHIWSAGWVYEDGMWLARVEAFHVARQHTGTVSALLRPRALTTMTWLLTPTPQLAHAANVILHGCVVMLVWLFARRLGFSVPAASLAALTVLIHPLTVESVAYAASRAELLAACGLLVACVLALGRHPWRWVGVIASLAAAIMSKESAIIGCLLVPLVAHRRMMWLAGFGAAASVAGLMQLALGQTTWQQMIDLGETPGHAVLWWDWLTIQATATYVLLAQTILPLHLTVDHDYYLVAPAMHVVAVALCLSLPICAWALRKRQPIVALGLTWTLIALAPRFVIQTPRSPLNEHQWYMPLIGLVLTVTAAVCRAMKRSVP